MPSGSNYILYLPLPDVLESLTNVRVVSGKNIVLALFNNPTNTSDKL